MSDVFVSLSEAELRERAEQLAGCVVALDELAEERKLITKELGERKEGLTRRVRKLSQVIRNKGEYQEQQAALFTVAGRENGKRPKKGDA
jgi:hypothetical protein